MTFARELVRRREAKRMSQERLCELTGIRMWNLDYMERDRVGNPVKHPYFRLQTAYRLSRALDWNLDEMAQLIVAGALVLLLVLPGCSRPNVQQELHPPRPRPSFAPPHIMRPLNKGQFLRAMPAHSK